jgi:hypothetical protein
MYAFAPEKPPGLAGRNFCLVILLNFREDINREQPFCLPEQARKCRDHATARRGRNPESCNPEENST